MGHRPSSEQLSARSYLAYAAPAVMLAMTGTTYYVFLPKFYSDTVGVRLSHLSLIILLSRIWDALIDPLAGHLSDRTRSRWGRRRPWMVAAALPLAVAFVCTALPPRALGSTGATVWFGASTVLLFLFWTAVVIPYEALGPELSFDYDVRNRLFAFREGAMILGTVLAAVFPELVRIAGKMGHTAGEERMRFAWVGFICGVLLLPAIWFCVRNLREQQLSDVQRPERFSLDGVRSVLQNRPFRILLIAYVISALGSQLPATLILFYVEYVLGSKAGAAFLLLYLLTGFAFVPVWVAAAGRWEKRDVWIAAMLLNTSAFAGVLFLGYENVAAYGVLVFFSALGLGGTVVLPASMEADVIDVDELRTGARREGVFSGIWSICKKLAAALGAGAALAVLDRAGYLPNVKQTPKVLMALRFLYAGIPCLCNIFAICIALAYPLNRETHQQIRRDIDARKGGGT